MNARRVKQRSKNRKPKSDHTSSNQLIAMNDSGHAKNRRNKKKSKRRREEEHQARERFTPASPPQEPYKSARWPSQSKATGPVSLHFLPAATLSFPELAVLCLCCLLVLLQRYRDRVFDLFDRPLAAVAVAAVVTRVTVLVGWCLVLRVKVARRMEVAVAREPLRA